MAARKKATAKRSGNGTKQGRKAPKAKSKTAKAKISSEDLAKLKAPVEEAAATLKAARDQAEKLAAKARSILEGAKTAYAKALLPYRAACRKAGLRCEFSGGRQRNVSERVAFLVEKTEKGVRVMVRGRPETEDVIPLAELKESVNRAAYGYVEAHIGPRNEVGNKGGSLSNRLRAVL